MAAADPEDRTCPQATALEMEVIRLQARVDAFMETQAGLNAAWMETEKEQWKAINQLKVNTAKWSAAAAAIGAIAGGGIPRLISTLMAGP